MTKFEECEAEILAIKAKFGYGVFDMVMRGLNRKRLSVDLPMKRRRLKWAEKEKLYGKQHGNCLRCRQHFEITELTEDHIKAIAEGGTNDIRNFRLVCAGCNSSKGEKNLIEDSKRTGNTALSQIP